MSNRVLTLFLTTLKIGAFTFGGGYAMIPLLEREFVQKHKWLEPHEIVDLFAVGQSLPGVIAVNSSIMVGYRVAKVKGAIAAALGIVLPSLFTLSVIAVFYRQFIENKYVAAAFGGIRAAVAALMVQAVVKLWKQSVSGGRALAICIAAFVIAAFFSVNAIWVIVAGAFIGFLCGIPGMRKNTPDAGNDRNDMSGADDNRNCMANMDHYRDGMSDVGDNQNSMPETDDRIEGIPNTANKQNDLPDTGNKSEEDVL